MIEVLGRIERYTVEGRDRFLSDEKTQDAVIRNYEIIGEVAKRLSSAVRDSAPEIDWKQLIGFRDFLAHNYDEIIIDFVWEAVADLPDLRERIEKLIQSLTDDHS
ncbi:MAG: DUF86 domain-containing protein [Chloroflexi bacterium]|nr:DUF86 domain-containing protein [Chloroflexota bacterium]